MKRAKGLIERVADPENLRLAFWKAQKGKRAQREVIEFRQNLGDELASLRGEFLTGTYHPGPYRRFRIHDPKEREICAAPFRDRVAQHALMNVCHPVFESYQIHDSYACRVGRGTHRAVERAQHFARRHDWFLKLDIRKYFDSIDQSVLKELLLRRIGDREVLRCFWRIIDSYETEPGKGVPIGNLTSQYFANHYLAVMDHYVKEMLRCRGYVRYMDDFVLWDEDKAALKAMGREIIDFLQRSLALEVKPVVLGNCARGMTFLGYRVFPEGIRLASRSRLRFRRKLAGIMKALEEGCLSEREVVVRAEPLIAFVTQAQSKAMRRRCLVY